MQYARMRGKESVTKREERELLLILARQLPLVLGANAVVGPGCLFGLLGYLASDPSQELPSVFTLMVLVGMTAGSIASLSAVTWTYRAFAIPTMAPIIFRYWAIGSATGLTIAMFGIVFLLVNLGYAKIQRVALIESIRLRFEKEELIRELEAARRRSDAANEAKTRFLLSAGHDLRQPLYAITLLIEAVGRHLPASAVRQAEAMRACAHTIDDLLDRMLEVARLDAGKTEAKLEDAPLQSVFQRLLVEFEPEAAKREVLLKCVDSSSIVKTDVHLLTCILRNFLSNALRYCAGGKVLMGARRLGDSVRIEVLDQGPGISPEHMDAIFEPFYQVGNVERAPENGHGLGLAIAKGMAMMMGAPLAARSQLHRGSVFSITLKSGAGGPPADTPALFIPQASVMDLPLILLVEDVAIVRETTRELLTAWGCRVIAAADGAQALAAVAQSTEPLDCVITDLRLPGPLDGFAIVRTLREKAGGALPAILTTADPAVGRGQAEGLTVLTKPVAPSRLKETLAALICKSSQADQS